MAGAPQFKVYTPKKEYIAACKRAEDAACLAGLYGAGSKVRWYHNRVVWAEGEEAQPAGESYDFAAGVIWDRVQAIREASYAKVYGTRT